MHIKDQGKEAVDWKVQDLPAACCLLPATTTASDYFNEYKKYSLHL
jgi:hypothetical protein